jgi:ABC-type transporter Mla maintaining outer membrane lipid asymmetry ATPase subunit MlaF
MNEVTIGSLLDARRTAIEGVNWEVLKGDFWALGGLQGTGKSDLLFTAAGLMAPVSGRYVLFGEPMPIFDEDRLATRLRLGIAFENGQLFHHLTVRENVSLPMRYHRNWSTGQAEASVHRILEATELLPWADSTPGALGRNWQKRAGLARALALDPDLLLVDDPLAGLDQRHANWWLNFLSRLASGKAPGFGKATTIIVTASHLTAWRTTARQFGILYERKLHLAGPWESLLQMPPELLHEVARADEPAREDIDGGKRI